MDLEMESKKIEKTRRKNIYSMFVQYISIRTSKKTTCPISNWWTKWRSSKVRYPRCSDRCWIDWWCDLILYCQSKPLDFERLPKETCDESRYSCCIFQTPNPRSRPRRRLRLPSEVLRKSRCRRFACHDHPNPSNSQAKNHLRVLHLLCSADE